MNFRNPLVLTLALTIAAAACGSDGDQVDTSGDGDDRPAQSCLETDPNCDAIANDPDLDTDDDSSDASDDDGDRPAQSCLETDPNCDAIANDPGLATCLAGDPDCADDPSTSDGTDVPLEPGDGTDTTVDAASGVFFVDDTGTYLCGSLLESFPPQCGDPVVEVVGVDVDNIGEYLDPDDDALVTAEGVSWTNSPVTLFGVLNDGVLTVG